MVYDDDDDDKEPAGGAGGGSPGTDDWERVEGGAGEGGEEEWEVVTPERYDGEIYDHGVPDSTGPRAPPLTALPEGVSMTEPAAGIERRVAVVQQRQSESGGEQAGGGSGAPGEPVLAVKHVAVDLASQRSLTPAADSSKSLVAAATEEEAVDANGDPLPEGVLPSTDLVSANAIEFAEDDKENTYLQGRAMYNAALEKVLQRTPFESYSLFRGQRVGQGKFLGRRRKPSLRAVGRFKGMIRLVKGRDTPAPFDIDKLLKPQQYHVRVYALNGRNIQAHDLSGTSDPYLKVSNCPVVRAC